MLFRSRETIIRAPGATKNRPSEVFESKFVGNSQKRVDILEAIQLAPGVSISGSSGTKSGPVAKTNGGLSLAEYKARRGMIAKK